MKDYSAALKKRIDNWSKSTGKPYLVLGHDVGIASDGFCLLDLTNDRILEMGSRLFDAPQEDKTKQSLAVTRRNKRSIRRNTKRTRDRMKKCLKILKAYGFVPGDADASWLQLKKGDIPTIWLRAKALDERISDRELAQILYTLCKRRGYIDHGKGGDAGDADEGKVLEALKKNRQELAEGGWRTVGEMLSHKGRDRNHGEDYSFMVTNEQIKDEARVICVAQRRLGNTRVNDEFINDYISCLTWQVSTYNRDKISYAAVGRCVYFTKLPRAARADLSNELCSALASLHHLVFVDEQGNEQHLSQKHIDSFIEELFAPKESHSKNLKPVTYAKIRKILKLDERSSFKGINRDDEKTKEPFHPRGWLALRGCYDDVTLEMLIKNRPLADALCEALTYASSKESFIDRFEELLAELEGPAPSDEIVDELISKAPYGSKVFSSYGTRSLKALDMLIGGFDGPGINSLYDAEHAVGLDGLRKANEEGHDRDELLIPFAAYCPDCKNPVVLRASAQVRKVTNAIIRRYGVPNEIHIELARDLKASNREKRISAKRKNAREALNKSNAARVAEALKCSPDEVSHKLLLKMALGAEQGWMDAYTGKAIDQVRVMTDDSYCQVDHILPLSRTCDDSRANKVLVLNKSNQDKGQRTPYEWMTSGEPTAPDWGIFKARVLEGCHDPRKKSHLLEERLDSEREDSFIGRNLSDTRYMSRLFKDWFEQCLLWPDDSQKIHVVAVAGGATASLRHSWGLNLGQGNTKDREDDRHHAVDAAVIAACSRVTVSSIAKMRSHGTSSFQKQRDSRLASTQPWDGFAEDVLTLIEEIVPTRAVSHGLSGCLYEDTLYHFEGYNQKGYPVLKLQGKAGKPKGNVRIYEDDSARIVANLAFIRLWLDPTAKKGKGKWYLEPVYYADLPEALDLEVYRPHACEHSHPRRVWKEVPELARKVLPITVFPSDVLVVDNHIGRFCSMNINTCSLSIRSVFVNAKNGPFATDFPTPGKWNASTSIRVLNQDCLGHCWRKIAIQKDSTAFKVRS